MDVVDTYVRRPNKTIIKNRKITNKKMVKDIILILLFLHSADLWLKVCILQNDIQVTLYSYVAFL